jgi:hypothetical protein
MISYVILYDIINIICDIIYDTVFYPTMQVLFVNEAVRKAQHGSPLHGLAPIVNPSDEIIEVLLAALRDYYTKMPNRLPNFRLMPTKFCQIATWR